MPIKRHLQEAVFGPDEIKAITAAFEGTCKTLGLVDRKDPLTEIVAVEIYKAAQNGARDADQIQRRALVSLHSIHQSSPAT